MVKVTMGYNEIQAQAKREELEAQIASQLQGEAAPDPEGIARAVVGHLVEITPPYFEPPQLELPQMDRMELITLQSLGGRRGGATSKPGNVRLNLLSLIKAVAGGSLTMAGSLGAPWMLVVGALLIWDSLYSSLKIELSEVHASVIWSMWKHKGEDRSVSKNQVAQLTNKERQHYGRQLLSQREVEDALKDLRRMKCIDQDPDDSSRWWLREWVKTNYS